MTATRTTLCRLASRLPWPPWTVRLRLTLLYGVLFLMSGAVLLVLTNVLFRNAMGNYLLLGGQGHSLFFSRVSSGRGTHSSFHVTPRPGAPSAQQLQEQAHQLAAQALAQHNGELHELLIQSLIALAIMAVTSVGLGWLVAGRALRPLRTMNIAARDISATNLHRRLGIHGPRDELAELAETFDDLLARLEASFDAQRQFVANASHELRTPLARQRTLIEVCLDDPDASLESFRKNQRRLLTALQEQEGLIEALLTLARSERGVDQPVTCNLADLARMVVGRHRVEAERQDITLHLALEPCLVSGDPALLQRLVANLVENALRYNAPGGKVEVDTYVTADCGVLVVENTGPVIAPGSIEQLLEPFRRGGRARVGAGGGTGLGLSIVKTIATAHHAHLELHALADGGLRVTVGFLTLTTSSGRETRPALDLVLNHRNSPLKTSATERRAGT
jgi:signal transduction histidine kinase